MNLIICELNELGAKSTNEKASNKLGENGGVTRRVSHHSQVLPGQFSRTPTTAIFGQNEPPIYRDAQDSTTADEPIPEYEALSWCWGDESDRAPVEIRIREKNEYGHWQSYRMEIAWTLATALQALRYAGTDRRLWVDAICINQGNVDERNRQVQMMAQIYNNASQVCIWLGSATKESEQALTFIRDNVIKLWKFDDLCAKQESSKDWNVFLGLMNRPWFSRRWVVQEIALARKAKIYCGSDNIDWQDFADAVSLFVEVESATHRLSEIMRRDEQFNHVPDFFGYVSALGATVLVEAVNTLFRESMDGSRREPLLSIEYLVSKMTVFGVTEPRDAIYSLLAIAKDTVPIAARQQTADAAKPGARQIQRWARNTAAKPYRVNYDQSIVDICQDFTIFCIRQAEKADPISALDIICRPWAPLEFKQDIDAQSTSSETSNTSEGKSLPSWIPSSSASAHAFFSQAGGEKMGRKNADPLVGLPGLGLRNYSAAGTKTVDRFALRFKKRGGSYSMYVKGFQIDQIAKKEVTSQLGNIPEEWLEAVNWKNTEEYPPQDFWKTLVADRGPYGRNPPAFYPRACRESVKKGGKEAGVINTEALIDHGRCSIVAEFLRRVQAVIWRKSLIRTAGGRLGLVHKDAKEGDLICILYGCTVPLILRRVKKGDDEIATDLNADQQEYETRITEAATKIQMKFRERRKARKKRGLPLKYAKIGKNVILGALIIPSLPGIIDALLSHHSVENRVIWTIVADLQRFIVLAATALIFLTPENWFLRLYYQASRLVQPNEKGKLNELNDRNIYYKLLGECYLHGMMNGEAILHQNREGIKQEVFEIQ